MATFPSIKLLSALESMRAEKGNDWERHKRVASSCGQEEDELAAQLISISPSTDETTSHLTTLSLT